MKITYVANIRMPTERAHGIQIVKTCEALGRVGVDVELIVPARRTHIHEPVEEYYGLIAPLRVKKLPVWDLISWGKIGFAIETLSFAFAAQRYIDGKAGIVYGRDEWVLAILKLFGFENIVWESHTGAWNIAARFLAAKTKIVAITEGLKDFYIAQGVPREMIVVAHDGVDPSMFENVESKETARARLGLPLDKKIALYIGSVGGWKGTNTLLEASTYLTAETALAVIGKVPEEMKARFPKVIFLGERPYTEIAHNQQAADVLVLPTTARHPVGAHFTSPLKLFTYMTSGIPIVASDVLSAREVLPHDGAYWFTPDEPESLAEAIHTALNDVGAREKARIAKREVARYTWEARATAILAFL